MWFNFSCAIKPVLITTERSGQIIEPGKRFGAVHARHGLIQNNQIELVRLVSAKLDAVKTRARRRNVKTGLDQDLSGQA